MVKKRLRRPCKKCNKLFMPTGRECWVCETCLKEYWNNRKLKGGKTK